MGDDIQNYRVVIRKVVNGFFVAVGCKRFVIGSVAELNQALTLLYTDPQAAIRMYYPQYSDKHLVEENLPFYQTAPTPVDPDELEP